MGILDEAIREHLELKRQHGADDSELAQLEDEAFGAAERPGSAPTDADSPSEAPTEFMAEPDAPSADAPAEEAEAALDEGPSRREGASRVADLQEPPEAPSPGEPAEEEDPAVEPEPAAETELPDPGHSTEERHAIADQPTEMFDVEEAMAAGSEPAPADEQLAEEEAAGPRLGDAAANVESEVEVEVEEDEDFWSEQRLSDELDQALEAPIEDEGEFDDEPAEEEAPVEPAAEEPPAPLADQRHEPATELQDLPPAREEPVPAAEEHTEEHAIPAADSEEDVLEDTPDFLEESPEDDELWFEQKPPKDFDFDD